MSELITNPNIAEARLRELVERFREHPLATTETYAFFEVNDEASVKKRNQQKSLFLKGVLRNPDLNFPQLEDPKVIDSIIEAENTMIEMMKDSTELAHDIDREAVLYDLLRVRRLEMGMLLLAHDLSNPEIENIEKEKLGEIYNELNDEINGPLEPARFNGLLAKQRQRAQELLIDEQSPDDIKNSASYYLAHTQELPAGAYTVEPVQIDHDRFLLLAGFIKERFADLLELVPDKHKDEKFSAEEVAEIFKRAHALRNTRWNVRLQPGKSSIDTRQNEQTTYVGTDRERTAKNTRGILVHENGVHVQRRINGDRTRDPLLAGTGLPWYLASEEGISTIFQQAIEGKPVDSGEQYYLAIGLTRGLDGRPRDFGEVYELELCRRQMADYLKKGQTETGPDMEKQRSQAYATVLRVRRGAPAELQGVAYTRDIAYYLGNQMMWEILLNMVESPENQRNEMFDSLMAAKHDPTNPLHAKLVEAALRNKEEE
jgi:hypothetical protein